MRLRLLLAIVLVLLPAPGAFAATASVGEIANRDRYSPTRPALIFSAAPGERNQLAVSIDRATGHVLLRDAGARVLAGRGCTAIDERTVRCVDPGFVSIDAGDGDDAVTIVSTAQTTTFVWAGGGDGADTLSLSGAGSLFGGPGRDLLTASPLPCSRNCAAPVLAGGPGDDVLRGGAGSEVLIGDSERPGAFGDNGPDLGSGDDVIDGGGGRDRVAYSERSAGVRVDLGDSAPDGARGERDRLENIEDVTGGDGADVLLGDAGDNALVGGRGSDTLSGRGGRDSLVGGNGADTLRGGDGSDKLSATDGDKAFGGAGDDRLSPILSGAMRLECGSGVDTIAGEPRGQLLSGCELVDFRYARISVRPQRRPGGGLRMKWGCTAARASGCGMQITLRLRSSRLAARSVSTKGGASLRSVVLRPTRPTRSGDLVEVVVRGGGLANTARGQRLLGRWLTRIP